MVGVFTYHFSRAQNVAYEAGFCTVRAGLQGRTGMVTHLIVGNKSLADGRATVTLRG